MSIRVYSFDSFFGLNCLGLATSFLFFFFITMTMRILMHQPVSSEERRPAVAPGDQIQAAPSQRCPALRAVVPPA